MNLEVEALGKNLGVYWWSLSAQIIFDIDFRHNPLSIMTFCRLCFFLWEIKNEDTQDWMTLNTQKSHLVVQVISDFAARFISQNFKIVF